MNYKIGDMVMVVRNEQYMNAINIKNKIGKIVYYGEDNGLIIEFTQSIEPRTQFSLEFRRLINKSDVVSINKLKLEHVFKL